MTCMLPGAVLLLRLAHVCSKRGTGKPSQQQQQQQQQQYIPGIPAATIARTIVFSGPVIRILERFPTRPCNPFPHLLAPPPLLWPPDGAKGDSRCRDRQ
ncbi:hypothetical protein BDY21DRAFT_344758 [Lineolata rhizophorae]|uniref:Secreted protein n=1 Tax=Lineolata rhizophorae TaxID=578093 RepID=A0A6A6NZC3_9PEZI|nr:hypothetical protein BDY21DRAFT_344758 [Lineolata rhizophorae]